MVIFNIEDVEISNNYNLGSPVKSTVVRNDTIVCATDNGLYKGCMKDNLLDFSKWIKLSNDKYEYLYNFDNSVLGKDSKGSLYNISIDNYNRKSIIANADVVNCNNNILSVYSDGYLHLFNSLSNKYSYQFTDTDVNHIYTVDGKIWISQGNRGLTEFSVDENNDGRIGLLPETTGILQSLFRLLLV